MTPLDLIPADERRATVHTIERLASLSNDELRQESIWPQTEEAALFGFQVREEHLPVIEDLRSTLDGFREPNAVWMDTTTVFRANRLLSAQPSDGAQVFDPLALLDLDTFTRNFVLYDQVLFAVSNKQDPWTDLRPMNEQLHEPVFVALFEDARVPNETARLFDDMHQRGRYWLQEAIQQPAKQDQFARWQQMTSDIFGVTPDERALDELVRGWGSYPAHVTRELLDADGGYAALYMWDSDEAQQQLIGDATARHVFNSSLSRMLGLPYHPAAARMPTAGAYAAGRGFAAQEAMHAELAVHVALQDLRSERLALLQRSHPSVEAAPVWAAALLTQANSAADLWPCLIELREKASSLRAARAALERELREGGEEKVLEQLAQSLRAERTRTWKLWAGVTTPVVAGLVAEALFSVGWYGYASGFAALVGAQLLSEDPAQLRNRLLRPRQVFLADLGASVTKLGETLPRAQRIWRLDGETLDRAAATLTRMSHLNWV